MGQLSSIFSDSFSAINDDTLTRTCQAVSKICDASSLNHESLRGFASALNPRFQFMLGSL
ncbi:hypothetical protein MKW92_013094, partial [Papaver armeniacum]